MIRKIKDHEEQKHINQSFNQKVEQGNGISDATAGGSGDDFNIKKLL